VDLSCLRDIKVDTDKKLAYAQGGATWADFNAATTAHGLVSPGGVVSHTGIGGLIVGGGMGYLTGQYGLCIDNLVEATVVVADGRIVKASEIENPDLFWGIRGTNPPVRN
jgi:FAD/FMN-containing dehydrogenase